MPAQRQSRTRMPHLPSPDTRRPPPHRNSFTPLRLAVSTLPVRLALRETQTRSPSAHIETPSHPTLRLRVRRSAHFHPIRECSTRCFQCTNTHFPVALQCVQETCNFDALYAYLTCTNYDFNCTTRHSSKLCCRRSRTLPLQNSRPRLLHPKKPRRSPQESSASPEHSDGHEQRDPHVCRRAEGGQGHGQGRRGGQVPHVSAHAHHDAFKKKNPALARRLRPC